MALSVVDLYKNVLPGTNCKDCGFPTCLAFAGMVVSERKPVNQCPHIEPNIVNKVQKELDEQYESGKWTKKDMAEDALNWAKKRSSSMKIKELPDRIGGKLIKTDHGDALELPYFNDFITITKDDIIKKDGTKLTRWEKVFIYNHMAQGGNRPATGKWKGFVEFPNTVSKIKSMVENVETPLIQKFKGKPDELLSSSLHIGGLDKTYQVESTDLAILFNPFPRTPVMLLFWDEDKEDGFDARVKLLFDETIVEHLDIESIIFLSERLKQLLCDGA